MKLKHYINGKWTDSSATEFYDVINPASEELLARTPLGTKAEVDAAVDAASQAYAHWKKTPVIDRIQPFFRLKSLMEKDFDLLAAEITKEHGKTLLESKGSVRRAIQMVETATSMPSLIMGEFQEDIAQSIDSHSVKQSMGVFAGIAPFNFPAMVPYWFWPFAVAAGNTYVLKPSERVPLTQILLTKLVEKAGFPPGVLNIVHGGKEVVNALCTHPSVKGVSFVGSTEVAKYVYKTSASHYKRVQSLGGAKNFMVILKDAHLEKAVDTALDSIIGCAGERCLAGSVIISIGQDVAQKVAEKMQERVKSIRIGDGMDPTTQMGPLISQAAKERICNMIDNAVKQGAELVIDGRIGVENMRGYFLKPTVLANIHKDQKIAQEEVFGPVICLATANSLDQAIEWINSSRYANTTTLFTTSGAAARKFRYEVHPGMVGINIGVPAPMSFFSFGGAKESFFGDIKVHGKASVDFFTDKKVTIERWSKGSSIW
ncbi:MAG: CoA-acylating methylmalonate-semialdehyde dehydrogenase [Bdellovibrionota bacterium]